VEAVVAVVVPKAGAVLAERQVLDFAHETLAPFKVPKRVVFADALPKNPSGKILKRELRDAHTGAFG
jgi:fatty-acyl-CoA synthase